MLATLIIGILTLVAFGVYEWKFIETEILQHDLFKGGKNGGCNFGICIGLSFIEGIFLFAYVVFYPVLYAFHPTRPIIWRGNLTIWFAEQQGFSKLIFFSRLLDNSHIGFLRLSAP